MYDADKAADNKGTDQTVWNCRVVTPFVFANDKCTFKQSVDLRFFPFTILKNHFILFFKGLLIKFSFCSLFSLC